MGDVEPRRTTGGRAALEIAGYLGLGVLAWLALSVALLVGLRVLGLRSLEPAANVIALGLLVGTWWVGRRRR